VVCGSVCWNKSATQLSLYYRESGLYTESEWLCSTFSYYDNNVRLAKKQQLIEQKWCELYIRFNGMSGVRSNISVSVAETWSLLNRRSVRYFLDYKITNGGGTHIYILTFLSAVIGILCIFNVTLAFKCLWFDSICRLFNFQHWFAFLIHSEIILSSF